MRRFKTETVVYLTTRWKLLTGEHHVLSPDNTDASYSIRRIARGNSRLRSCFPVIITVAWRDLATTVANEWNGNQMQIWLPFVFYTPPILLTNRHPTGAKDTNSSYQMHILCAKRGVLGIIDDYSHAHDIAVNLLLYKE